MIRVEGLTFGYDSSRDAVQDLTLRVDPGQIVGLLGPSGSGKSTTQRILTGVLSPYRGSAVVLGKELREYGAEYYHHIGVGFELPNHFGKLTAQENLEFFASFYRQVRPAREMLAMVGLDEHRDRRVEQFSKGMKMRLNFIRALQHEPDVLFLDEPTSGLDPATARVLKDAILQQRDLGRTILLTTHNMHDADELCDRVAFLVDGVIHTQGAPRDLRARAGEQKVTVDYRDGDVVHQRQFELAGVGHEPEFLRLLQAAELVALNTRRPSLEGVFIATTGRRLL